MTDALTLAADVTSHHIEGIAREGDTPFSVSLISKIDETLWQGGCQHGVSLGGRFTHIVSLYPWEQYDPGGEIDSYTIVRLYDGPTVPDPEQLYALARWINLCRKHGPTLVHCQAGLNRSGLLTALALILEGATPAAAIERLRASRCAAVLCNHAFETWLLEQPVAA